MRTTLSIDDDVLLAAKELARTRRSTAGRVLSESARAGLQARQREAAPSGEDPGFLVFRPFPAGDRVVTNEDVDRVREAEGI